MKIAIVENHVRDREDLLTLLEYYFSHNHISPTYDLFSSGEAFMDCFSSQEYDAVFLDIYLEEISGMDLARKLVNRPKKYPIIFCTNSYDHAIESYEVQASYYLTKPLIYKKLEPALNYILKDILVKNSTIIVKVNHIDVTLLLGDVLYVDCVQKQTHLYLPHQTLYIDESITALIGRLCTDSRFLFCNRGIAVNMEWIQAINDSDILLKNGVLLPMRQRKRKELKKSFLEFSLSNMRAEATL